MDDMNIKNMRSGLPPGFSLATIYIHLLQEIDKEKFVNIIKN